MNKTKWSNFLIAMVLFVIFDKTTLFAELYQWTDENGSIHYSDDPTNAPKGKSPDIRRDEPCISPSLPRNITSTVNPPERQIVEVIFSKDKQICMQFDDDGLKFTRDVVIDSTTDLMWASNGNIAGKAMSWRQAQRWVRSVNYGGHNDWRLPTKEELTAIAKRGQYNTLECFKANGFTNFTGGWYWSSTVYDTNYTWGVSMYDGSKGYSINEFAKYVWPVRAVQ